MILINNIYVNNPHKQTNAQIKTAVITSNLKYYFAVDTKYVTKKLFMLLFPYHHKVTISTCTLYIVHCTLYSNYINI